MLHYHQLVSTPQHSQQQYQTTRQRFLTMSNEFGWHSVNWFDFFSNPEHVLPKGLLSCSAALPITQEAQQQPSMHQALNSQNHTSTAMSSDHACGYHDDSHDHSRSTLSSRRKSLGIKRRDSCLNSTQVIYISDDEHVEEITKDNNHNSSLVSSSMTQNSSNPPINQTTSTCFHDNDDGEAEYEFKEEESENEDPEIYEIEKILKKRIRNAKPEYYVKWVGYPTCDNSWVKKSDIFDEECIKEFEESLASQQAIDLCEDSDEEESADSSSDHADSGIEFDEEDSDCLSNEDANDFLLSDDDDENDGHISMTGKKTNKAPKLDVIDLSDMTPKKKFNRSTPKAPIHSKYITDSKQFKKVRGQLLQKYYDEFNSVCFKNKLPALKLSEGKSKDLKGKPYLLWNHHLRKTAGYCKLFTLKKTKNGKTTTTQLEKVVAIEISTKVCDCEERLVHTLAHEMCHAASFLFDGITGHGKTFYSYGDLIRKYYPDIPITTCHSYSIDYKYQWQCVDCGSMINRHSKSVDVSKQCCGICKGRLQEVGKSTKNSNNAYNNYVKEHYKRFKESHPHLKQGEIMKLVAQAYREQQQRI
ncbi:hypothetical protein C9374_002732 [Naegleria lovaniensis]|uniref:Chromo domain-containing protein n=1 Tax=Naegleria lovaniensis TaxID=51637 RepID=A0AA88GUY5_NAELO|nr:uncharacterized protein C9374_002732 [Naegleria lovaniensis]KAG2386286.1 hypothetical protein C9374_002732 [Naegleria lovaniensis]